MVVFNFMALILVNNEPNITKINKQTLPHGYLSEKQESACFFRWYNVSEGGGHE